MAKKTKSSMTVGMIGLGRMGANMALRLMEAGHHVVTYDVDPDAVRRLQTEGADGAHSVEALIERLEPPRSVWIMVPAGSPVDATIDKLLGVLEAGDVILDGGNSYYRDTIRRSTAVAKRGMSLIDVGTSGGVWGRTEGYSMMIGGDEDAVERLRPVFEALAPGPTKGWGHVGPSGAGHFTKMVHNGIEYGLMQAYAEGFSLLKHKEDFALDLHQVAEIWRYGSVVRSWLLDLAATALAEDQSFADIAPYVSDSGEGRWTVFESIDLDVPAPVIALSLIQRLRSRDEESYADRMLAALRNQFGGHAVKQDT